MRGQDDEDPVVVLEALRRRVVDEACVLDDLEPAPTGRGIHLRWRRRDGETIEALLLPADLPGLAGLVGAPLARRRGGRDRDRSRAEMPGDGDLDLGTSLGAWGDNPADEAGGSEYLPLDFGPLHPLCAGRFRLLLKGDGDRVQRAAVETGYARRGVEDAVLRVGWTGAGAWLERWIEDDPVAPRLAWCLLLEAAAGITAPRAAQRLRVLESEVARLVAHARALAATLEALGDELRSGGLSRGADLLAATWREGGGGLSRPGGYAGGPDSAAALDALIGAELRFLTEVLTEAHAATLEDASFRRRARGCGAIAADWARAAGASGAVLRATGVALDARHDEPREASPWRLAGLRPEAVAAEGGDVLARTEVRLGEMRSSLRLLDRIADEGFAGPRLADERRFADLEPEDRTSEALRSARVRGDLGFAPGRPVVRVEAATGTIGLAAEIDQEGGLAGLFLRAPDLAHLGLLERALVGASLDDLALIIASFDLRGGGIDG